MSGFRTMAVVAQGVERIYSGCAPHLAFGISTLSMWVVWLGDVGMIESYVQER